MISYEKYMAIRYTYIHHKVVIYLTGKYVKKYRKDIYEEVYKQVKNHDIDKLFLYLFSDYKDVKRIHRDNNLHHENNLIKDEISYIEMVLDWESARYTKDDKPLNAYDTLYSYYPSLEENILPILKEFGLDKSNRKKDDDIENYVLSIKDFTWEDIKKDMINYIKKLEVDDENTN